MASDLTARQVRGQVREALDAAAALVGSEVGLAKALGCSQGRLSNAKIRGRVTPELAMQIHKVTEGQVPGSQLRPDLWRDPNDVPIERLNGYGKRRRKRSQNRTQQQPQP